MKIYKQSTSNSPEYLSIHASICFPAGTQIGETQTDSYRIHSVGTQQIIRLLAPDCVHNM